MIIAPDASAASAQYAKAALTPDSLTESPSSPAKEGATGRTMEDVGAATRLLMRIAEDLIAAGLAPPLEHLRARCRYGRGQDRDERIIGRPFHTGAGYTACLRCWRSSRTAVSSSSRSAQGPTSRCIRRSTTTTDARDPGGSPFASKSSCARQREREALGARRRHEPRGRSAVVTLSLGMHQPASERRMRAAAFGEGLLVARDSRA